MEYIYYLILSVLLSAAPGGTPSSHRIVVDKPSFQLHVIASDNDTLATFPVALGMNCGDKRQEGDRKTPEGHYKVVSIEDSTDWDGDASGSDYGPWFLRLGAGKWDHIGIHGTNVPSSVGKRASLGCVRLHNADLVNLRRLVGVGSDVSILPDTSETYVAPMPEKQMLAKAAPAHRHKGHHHARRHHRH